MGLSNSSKPYVVAEHLHTSEAVEDTLPCGCPSTTVTQFERPAAKAAPAPVAERAGASSLLTHWPVQLTLVPPGAPFLQGADLVLAADCVPFAYADFHRDFLSDHALLVACPKLDDFQAHQSKLNDILRQSGIKSLTVVRMEVTGHLLDPTVKTTALPVIQQTIDVLSAKPTETDQVN